MKLRLLKVIMPQLDGVKVATEIRRERTASGEGNLGRVVTLDVILDTRQPGCHCEDGDWMWRRGKPPLIPGMLVSELSKLESGCCEPERYHKDGTKLSKIEMWAQPPKWICPRLDKLRRSYGL
jgi:hypothetical protein